MQTTTAIPYRCNGHILAIWTLPTNDCDYSKRWDIIKKHFTQNWLAHGGIEQSVTASRLRYRRRGIWQRRFWEHAFRDELDYQKHFDYVHFNPVKHGLVKQTRDWPYSLFCYWLTQSVYTENGGISDDNSKLLNSLQTVGE